MTDHPTLAPGSSQTLATVADTLYRAMMATNANERTAPQFGVYGKVNDALQDTLRLISPEHATDCYGACMQGDILPSEWFRMLAESQTRGKYEGPHPERDAVLHTMTMEGWSSAESLLGESEYVGLIIIQPRELPEMVDAFREMIPESLSLSDLVGSFVVREYDSGAVTVRAYPSEQDARAHYGHAVWAGQATTAGVLSPASAIGAQTAVTAPERSR